MRKWLQLAFAFTALSLVGIGIWLGWDHSPYFCSPTAHRAFFEHPPDTPKLLGASIGSKFSDSKNFPIPVETALADLESKIAKFPDGTAVEPIAAAIGYPIYSPDNEGYQLRITEFNPQTGEITKGLAETHPKVAARLPDWPRSIISVGSQAACQVLFIFEMSGMKSVMPRNSRMRDAQTRYLQDCGRPGLIVKTLEGTQYGFISFFPNALHPFDSEVEIEFSHGEVEDIRLPLKTGAGYSNDVYKMRLAQVFGPDLASSSWSTLVKDEIRTVIEVSQSTLSYAPSSQFVTNSGEMVPAFRKPLMRGLSGSSKRRALSIVGLNTTVPLEEIESLRIRFPKKHKHAKFSFAPFPGLPSENSNVTDLMDVRVPFYRGTPLQLLMFVGGMGQVSYGDSFNEEPIIFHIGGDQIEFVDSSVGDIWKHVIGLHESGKYHFIDRNTWSFESRRPLSDRARELWPW